MHKKHKPQLKQLARKTTVFLSLGTFCFAIFISFTPAQRVEAAGEDYALYYKDNASTRRSIAEAWDNQDSYDNPGWYEMSILATGGIWGEKKVLKFDKDITIEFNDGGNLSDTVERAPYFTERYFCSKDDGKDKITFERPADNKAYYEILYAVAFDRHNANSGEEFVKLDKLPGNSAAGPALVKSIKLIGSGSRAYNNYPGTLVFDITDYQKGGDLGKDSDGANLKNGAKGAYGISDANKGCRPPHGEISLPVFNSLSPDEKKKFKAASEEAAAATGGATPGSDEPVTDCDQLSGGPLGWIMCPLIDAGANLSDFVFKDIVRPLMSDIPIDTRNKNDGTYGAWQGFRFLANVMLVGTMLAIVYAQARGDR